MTKGEMDILPSQTFPSLTIIELLLPTSTWVLLVLRTWKSLLIDGAGLAGKPLGFFFFFLNDYTKMVQILLNKMFVKRPGIYPVHRNYFRRQAAVSEGGGWEYSV